jgi:beta-N-acetylhexosaminidase
LSNTVRRSLGQSLIIGLKGPALTPEESKFISENNIGGVIFFGRNLETPEQILALCRDLQKLSTSMPDRVPLFISIDMEGGRVLRLKEPFTKWPTAAALGKLNSSSVVFELARAMGTELFSIGINMDFAPSCDILTNPKNTVIGDRAFGTDAETVSKLASAFVRGLVKSNIIACAKHFPGHGNTLVDSHEDLPIEETTEQQLEAREMVPFKRTFRARLDLVMTSHILFKNVDPTWPATLSPKIVNGLLREKLRYRNLVVTDDMGMKAITKKYEVGPAAVQAYKAGCNILLYCNDFAAPEQAMKALVDAATKNELDANEINANHRKILDLKKSKIKNFNLGTYSEIQHLIGPADHVEMAAAVTEGRMPKLSNASGDDGD